MTRAGTAMLAAAFLIGSGLAACGPAADPRASEDGSDEARFSGRKGVRADLNGDGKITLEESRRSHREMLHSADTDGDGVVSAVEIAVLPERRATRVRAMDTDGDGAVSEAECVAAATARFHRRDLNHDGVISGAEIQKPEFSGAPDEPELPARPLPDGI